ncbi:15721_t:CDS:1 [Acaulospora colombiana]|uniref:15721_t:CDS:1 n=1 Tax=Acaulospora colombiana TaxID=27376 RepID=A0ACA9NY31_9GLOM|nr:15721_t:CDS:1 [Acaulospora colombiana]
MPPPPIQGGPLRSNQDSMTRWGTINNQYTFAFPITIWIVRPDHPSSAGPSRLLFIPTGQKSKYRLNRLEPASQA